MHVLGFALWASTLVPTQTSLITHPRSQLTHARQKMPLFNWLIFRTLLMKLANQYSRQVIRIFHYRVRRFIHQPTHPPSLSAICSKKRCCWLGSYYINDFELIFKGESTKYLCQKLNLSFTLDNAAAIIP